MEMKETWLKKGLVVSVILLFIGVAVAPSINFTVVKASDDNNLVEVTSQACGIQGFGNTTEKLTKEQYQNLEQYLVDFRARLNQTTTREEAVPIFKDAVVELNKYGLLPNGMSAEKAQKLVIGSFHNPMYNNIIKRIHKSNTGKSIENYFCLIGGITSQTYPLGFIGFSEPIISILWLFGLFPHLMPVQFLGPVAFGNSFIQWTESTKYKDNSGGSFPAQGWIAAVGSNGKTVMSGPFYGVLDYYFFGINLEYWTYYIGINSFTGLIIGFQGGRLVLGFAHHLALADSYLP